MNFKMHNCDFGFVYDSTTYEFDHVESVVVEDPEVVTLIRGSNVKNKEGIVITQGTKDPKVVTITLIGISKTLFDLFQTVFEAKDRCEAYAIDRTDGSSRLFKQSILSKRPRQMSIAEDPENLNVVIELHTYDIQEVHKA